MIAIIEIGFFQVLVFLLFVLLLVPPLGLYIARVYGDGEFQSFRFFRPFENLIYRFCRIEASQEMGWMEYLSAMLICNFLGFIFVYAIQRLQFYLPLNPQHFVGVMPKIAFNTAVSFITNSDWQAYSGETTMSYFTQMFALTVQNFISAATGLAMAIAVIRGLIRTEATTLGNFWVDLVRGILYVLLPLAIIWSILLMSQGVLQNFKPYENVNLLQPTVHENPSKIQTIQILPMGPVASQVAIKQLGSNGGGFFNTNSAHPFENPTPFSNFVELVALILIPAALCYAFGVMVNDKRQGIAILIAMLILFVPFSFVSTMIEQQGTPSLQKMGVSVVPFQGYPGGNMEGKETRFGIMSSTLWAVATTASSNGSVNAMLDSFEPLSGMVSLWMLHLGEVVFGGVGSGLYGMLMMIIIAVFVAGLMVGRTPEYLGKKIEPFEMKMASLAVLFMPLFVLLFTAIASVTKAGTAAIANPGPHGFTEILYAFTSMANNNGSAFAGLNAAADFYTLLGGISMLIGRYWFAIPTLAIAGSLARKKKIPSSSGTLPTHSFMFIILLVVIITVLGALTFLPALSLGPVIEHLRLWRNIWPLV